MKKFILMAGTALLLVGCDQGGTSDNYGTSGGAGSQGTSQDTTIGSTTNQGTTGGEVTPRSANP